ncbi:MAG: hypothetical protein ACRBK7_22670 [Acidimicrobiales bacterium]
MAIPPDRNPTSVREEERKSRVKSDDPQFPIPVVQDSKIVRRRPEEDVAQRVLVDAIGLRVDSIDDGSKDRMPDILGRRDGKTVAVEVTQVGSEERFKTESFVKRTERIEAPELADAWMAQVGDGVASSDYRRRMIEVALISEEYDFEPFPTWPGQEVLERHSEDISWYFSQADLCLRRWDGEKGQIFLLNSGYGGAVATNADALGSWFDAEVKAGTFTRKVSKLNEAAADEQHLFLVVQPHGLPFEVLTALTDTDEVPREAPLLPEGVTDIWFAPVVAFVDRPIIHWSGSSKRWFRRAYPPKEADSKQ